VCAAFLSRRGGDFASAAAFWFSKELEAASVIASFVETSLTVVRARVRERGKESKRERETLHQ
jgi:hypothetical protein